MSRSFKLPNVKARCLHSEHTARLTEESHAPNSALGLSIAAGMKGQFPQHPCGEWPPVLRILQRVADSPQPLIQAVADTRAPLKEGLNRFFHRVLCIRHLVSLQRLQECGDISIQECLNTLYHLTHRRPCCIRYLVLILMSLSHVPYTSIPTCHIQPFNHQLQRFQCLALCLGHIISCRHHNLKIRATNVYIEHHTKCTRVVWSTQRTQRNPNIIIIAHWHPIHAKRTWMTPHKASLSVETGNYLKAI